jgi:hypothetical protein
MLLNYICPYVLVSLLFVFSLYKRCKNLAVCGCRGRNSFLYYKNVREIRVFIKENGVGADGVMDLYRAPVVVIVDYQEWAGLACNAMQCVPPIINTPSGFVNEVV